MLATPNYRLLVLVLAVLATLASGSHALAADEVATVSGAVTFDGKIPSDGRIFFHQEDGQFVGAKIDKNGKFKVNRVLVGTHKVTIEFKGVPPKYSSEEVTPLQVSVMKTANQFDFELSSK